MPCVNCQASTNVPPGGLTPNDICNGKYITSDCVIYAGVPLSTIDIENGDTFTTIVNNINNVVNNIVTGAFTADNGLTNNIPTNVQLGGTTSTNAPLLHNTYVYGTASYFMEFTGAKTSTNEYTLRATNTSTGSAFLSTASGGTGISIRAISSGGDGVYSSTTGASAVAFNGTNTNGDACYFESTSASALWGLGATTSKFTLTGGVGNNIDTILLLEKNNSVVGVNGNGVALDIYAGLNDGSALPLTGKIINRYTSVVDTSENTSIDFWNLGSGTLARKLQILGTGQLVLDNYGIGTFTGTLVNNLGVTSTGTVIETLAIIPFRQTLSALQCATLNTVPVDITDLPAPGAGFAWEIITMSVSCILGITDYNFDDIQIIADTALTNQFSYNYGATTSATSNIISRGTVVNANNSGGRATVIDNKKMIIQTEIDPTVGNGSFVVYGTARKIQL